MRCGRPACRASRCRLRRAGYGRRSRRRIAARPRNCETRAMDPRQAWPLARRAVEAWTGDYAPSMGAALSYYALFSIAPLLLIVIGVAGFFFGEEAARGEIFGQLSALVGADGARAIEGLVASARKPQSGVLAMIYKMIPRVRIVWRDVWVGAAVTAGLFAVGKWLIGLYIGKSSVTSAFGAAGSLVVLMLWVYYSAQIFLLGAEFTRVFAEEHGSRAPSSDEGPARVTTHIRVQAAANSPVAQPASPVGAIAKLGAALALGVGASIGLGFLRRR